jgi:GNAT superfamily N-acetyltransferase
MSDWVSTGIGDHHVLDEFDCGVDKLNRWLAESALRADSLDTARTYVWVQRGERKVMAYFAITPTVVDRVTDGISKTAAGRMDYVPAYLLAKLAVDKSIAGQGNGRQLVLDAITRMVGVSQVGAGRLIVVDAIDDDTTEFYKKLDFIPVTNTPRRLYMKIATARAVLGVGQSVREATEVGAAKSRN